MPRSKDSPDKAFLLPGSSISCLLLHGFTASPHEMRFLGNQLNNHGYTVRGARLAGHGTSVDDLARSTRQDWYASARQALRALRKQSPQVAIVGQSMGALLALRLAVEHPSEVSAVALLAPAMRLSKRWVEWARPLLPWLAYSGYSFPKEAGDIADAEARAERRAYRRMPLCALHQLLELQQEVRPLLSAVRQPALVIHSRQDHTCSLEGVHMLENALTGPVHTVILEKSYHVVSVDVERERVAATVAAFVADTSPAQLPKCG